MCVERQTCVVKTRHMWVLAFKWESPHICGETHTYLGPVICVVKHQHVWSLLHMCGVFKISSERSAMNEVYHNLV